MRAETVKETGKGKKHHPTVTKEAVKGLEEAKKRIEEARKCYGDMQRSWFFFAKTVKEIRDNQDFKHGFSSFQEFCEKEFATVNYSTISKFITIVESWGKSIEDKLKKDKDFQLPAYETCYTLTTAKSKMADEEFSALKKQILDHKMSYYALRAELKSKIVAHRKSVSKEIDEADTDEIEKQLVKDLAEEDGDLPEGEFHEGMEFMDHDEVHDEDIDEVPNGDVIGAMESRVEFLLENIADHTEQLVSKGKVTAREIELATKIDKLNQHFSKYLETVEELS